MERLTLGSITIDALSDGEMLLPMSMIFPEVDLAHFRSLGGVDEQDNCVTPLMTYVIRTANQLILVDTGIGPDLGSLARFGFSGNVGHLPKALEAARIDPRAVDAVVFTHLHADHIGWTATTHNGDSAPLFPNAHHIVLRDEWVYWSDRKSKAVAQLMGPAQRNGQLRLVDDGYEPAPGVRLFATPGHTPGHAAVIVREGSEGAVITGDAAHHPAEIEEPHTRVAVDVDPEMAIESRVRLVDRIEAEGLTVLGGHFAPPGIGRLTRTDGRRTWTWLK